ncbi:hypothetical protein N474_25625, partial [Pseudoalteromonas luteoviolacea CPMOR-2]
MEHIKTIIKKARDKNVVLYLKDGALAYSAEAGAFTAELKSLVINNKAEIIAYLKGENDADERLDIAPFSLLDEGEVTQFEGRYEDAYPMSALQKGMVFHTQLDDFSGVYHDIMAEHIKCEWHPEFFQRALTSCLKHHPILRTRLAVDLKRPMQMVHENVSLPLVVEDIRHLSTEEQSKYLADWTEKTKTYKFDWENDSLFQVSIFLRTDVSFEFVINFHHAILDGWSRAIFSMELYAKYSQLLAGGELVEEGSDWTFRDYIALEQEVIKNPEATEFFKTLLSDAPTSQLTAFEQAGLNGSLIEHKRQSEICYEPITELSAELIALAKNLGVSVQSVYFSAHLKVLSFLSGQANASSCITVNGRPESAASEKGLGLYLNSLPFSLEVGGKSWRELINSVAKQLTQIMDYRRYPMMVVQQDTGKDFSDITFNYTHFHVYKGLASEQNTNFEVLSSTVFEQTNFDFHVDVSRVPDTDEVKLFFKFNPDKFDPTWIEQVGKYYKLTLQHMLADLDRANNQCLLLDKAEQTEFAALNDTARAY